jgi:hypothetical protein
MSFPLSFSDISVWLASTSIILLITTELVSPYYGQTKLLINKKRLKNIALALGILFLITIVINAIGMIYSFS